MGSFVSERVPALGGRIKGNRLEAGATFAVVSPASPVLDEAVLFESARLLRSEGFEITFSEHLNERGGYAAGPPEHRARDLEAAFADPDVDAILCLGGGHATGQVLPLLDYDLIAANPKPFVGFSDITGLHAALAREIGLVTFWGPMFAMLGSTSELSRRSLVRALTSSEPLGTVDPAGMPVESLAPGVAEGELLGGTTQILCTLMGTPWQIETRGKILLLEDVRRDPCRIHRDLTQLLNAGLLQQCAGICISEHTECEPDPLRREWNGPTLELEDVLAATVVPLGIPVLYGLPLGHGRHLETVPFGIRARLDADAGVLELLEPALV